MADDFELPADAVTDGESVAIVDPDGRRGTIPVAKAKEYIGYGYRLATQEENADQYRQNKYGESPVTAAVEGAARTASFGLSDVLLPEIGVSKEGLRERRARNATASTLGEIGGAFVPMGAGGLIAKAGEGVGGLARAAVGEGSSVAGRIASKVIPGAANAATQGALYGGQQTVSQVALSDHPLAADAILGALGHNVFWGSVAGGALGGLGGLVEGAALEARGAARAFVAKEGALAEGKAASSATDLVQTIEAKPETVTSAANPGGHAEFATERAEAAAGLRTNLTALKTASEELVPQAEKLEVEVLAKHRAKLGEELKGLKSQWEELNGQANTIDAKYESGEFAAMTMGAPAPGRNKSDTALQKSLMAERDALDAKMTTIKEQMAALPDLKKAAAEVEKTAKAVAPLTAAAEKSDGALVKAVAADPEAVTQAVAAHEQAAEKLAQAVEQVAPAPTATAPTQVPSKGSGLVDALKHFGASKLLRPAVHGMAQTAAHALGLGFMGHALAGMATEALLKGASTVVKEHGAKLAAGVDMFLGAAANAAPKAARAAVVPAARVLRDTSFIPPTGPPPRKASLGDHAKARVSEIASAVANPGGTQQAVHTALSGIRAMDPKLAQQVEDGAMRVVNYLGTVMPKNPGLGGLGAPDNWHPSDSVSDAFGRHIAAALDPGRIIAELKAGHVSIETVEATKAVHPATYEAIQSMLLDRVIDLQKTLGYRQRIQLGIIFGAATDPTLRPEFVAAMQMNFADSKAQNQGQAQAPKRSGSLGHVKAPDPTQAQHTSY